MDKVTTKKETLKAECVLRGTKVCPKPKECDGFHRLCSAWKNHSSK